MSFIVHSTQPSPSIDPFFFLLLLPVPGELAVPPGELARLPMGEQMPPLLGARAAPPLASRWRRREGVERAAVGVVGRPPCRTPSPALVAHKRREELAA